MLATHSGMHPQRAGGQVVPVAGSGPLPKLLHDQQTTWTSFNYNCDSSDRYTFQTPAVTVAAGRLPLAVSPSPLSYQLALLSCDTDPRGRPFLEADLPTSSVCGQRIPPLESATGQGWPVAYRGAWMRTELGTGRRPAPALPF